MMMTFDARAAAHGALLAALHPMDGTARAQFVDKARSPAFHDLLGHFQRLRGIAAVLNTSFNLHGEPIVASAGDAVDVFLRSGLRHMQLGRYIVTKPPG